MFSYEELISQVEKYKAQALQLRAILESPQGIIIFSLDTRYCYTAFTKQHATIMKEIWGVTITVGMCMLDVIQDPTDRAQAKANFDRALRGFYVTKLEEYGDKALRRTFWEDRYSPMFDDYGTVIGLTVFVTDMTQYVLDQERINTALIRQNTLEQREKLLQSLGEGVYGLDLDGNCTFVNNKALTLLGYTHEEFIGANSHNLIHHHYPDGRVFPLEECPLHKVRITHEQIEQKDWLCKKDGTFFPARLIVTPLLDSGINIGTVVAFSDITSQILLEKELREDNSRLEDEASHDPLTRLFNRRHFDRVLPKEIALALSGDYPLTLLSFDIDHFKAINDTYGHAVGDEVLRTLGETIKPLFRTSDLVARIGGEEFAIALPQISYPQALEMAQRLQKAARDLRIARDGYTLTFTISIGIAQLDPEHPTKDHLMAKADAKMYEAKKSGRDCIR